MKSDDNVIGELFDSLKNEVTGQKIFWNRENNALELDGEQGSFLYCEDIFKICESSATPAESMYLLLLNKQYFRRWTFDLI